MAGDSYLSFSWIWSRVLLSSIPRRSSARPLISSATVPSITARVLAFPLQFGPTHPHLLRTCFRHSASGYRYKFMCVTRRGTFMLPPWLVHLVGTFACMHVANVLDLSRARAMMLMFSSHLVIYISTWIINAELRVIAPSVNTGRCRRHHSVLEPGQGTQANFTT